MECAICLESSGNLVKNSEYIERCKCEILYHRSCLDIWYDYSGMKCPVCKSYNDHFVINLHRIINESLSTNRYYCTVILKIVLLAILYIVGCNMIIGGILVVSNRTFAFVVNIFMSVIFTIGLIIVSFSVYIEEVINGIF